MPDNASTEIADNLIEQHGLDGAIRAAMEYTATAGDNYTLSVWREVKTILQKKTGPEGPASLTGEVQRGR